MQMKQLFYYKKQYKFWMFRKSVHRKNEVFLNEKYREKAGGTEWIIAILMGEVVAQDLN